MDVLLTALAVALGLTVVLGVIAVLTVLFGWRRFKKRNRISPDHATDAPLTWMYSPVLAARLHRRLRSAVAVARVIQGRHAGDPTPPGHVALAEGAEQQALAVGQQLTVVGHLAPVERRRMLNHLGAEVARIEQLVSRLSRIDADAGAPALLGHEPRATQDLFDKLELLDEARREVAATEKDAGLRSPSPLPDPGPSPAPAPRSRTRRAR